MKKKETKLINKVYHELTRLTDTKMVNVLPGVFKSSLEESKGHDRWRHTSIARGISVQTEAKYFIIKQLFEFYQGNNPPLVKEFNHVRTSVYACYSLLDEYQEELKPWLENKRTAEVASYDYCELIQPNS